MLSQRHESLHCCLIQLEFYRYLCDYLIRIRGLFQTVGIVCAGVYLVLLLVHPQHSA